MTEMRLLDSDILKAAAQLLCGSYPHRCYALLLCDHSFDIGGAVIGFVIKPDCFSAFESFFIARSKLQCVVCVCVCVPGSV